MLTEHRIEEYALSRTETRQLVNHQWTLDNGMTGGIRLPFSRKGILDVSDDGKVYSANTDDFLIRVYHPEDGYRRAIYHPFQNDPLEEQEALHAFIPICGSGSVMPTFPIPGRPWKISWWMMKTGSGSPPLWMTRRSTGGGF